MREWNKEPKWVFGVICPEEKRVRVIREEIDRIEGSARVGSGSQIKLIKKNGEE